MTPLKRGIRQIPALRVVFTLILTASLLVSGCSMVRSESDVLGEYELRATGGKIVLSLSPDKSFSETIYWPNGKVEGRSGKWTWSQNGISFDQLWVPPVFAPDYIVQADASARANRQPKYTEPGHWYMRPERHWGTVIVPVFDDVNFEMVRRFRQ